MPDPNQAAMALFSPQGRRDPYSLYAVMREAAPVLKSPFGVWMVTRHEPVDRVLRSAAFRAPRGYREADDPAGPPRFRPDGLLARHRRHWVLFESGATHARLRKLIMKVFTPSAVRALAPRIEALVEEILAPALQRGGMEVISELAYPLPATVICELLGVPAADRDRNRDWADAVGKTLDPICSDAEITAAETAMVAWDAYVRELMAERRRHPGQALLDAMLAVEDEGSRFTDDEVAANTTLLFLAGHETTTGLIGNGLLALLRHPDQLARLRDEPHWLENAVEEMLRFDSPIQFAARVTDAPAELEGVQITPGIPVNLVLGSANHDPRRHQNPGRFDITRPEPRPLSFGAGAHFCVGAALARLEARIAFGRLLARTRSMDADTSQPQFRPSLTLRCLSELAVDLQPA